MRLRELYAKMGPETFVSGPIQNLFFGLPSGKPASQSQGLIRTRPSKPSH